MIDEELKKAIIENKETLARLDQRLHRIEKKFIWNTIFGFLKFLVIWGPIIAGIIYFTPVLKDYIKIFDPLLDPFKERAAGIVPINNSNASQNDFAIEVFCDPEARDALINQLCQ
ncbi:hypothetical protein KKH39_05015 [Patescibacteria group bacterium]|nr:hypothetical protein [Patescibacteria group bacterium]